MTIKRIYIFAASFFITSCSHGEFIWASEIENTAYNHETDRIQPGDEVEIKFWKHEELDTKSKVGSDGTVNIMFIGRIKIANKTESEAEKEIKSSISGFIIDPNISLKIIQSKEKYASVIGEVKKPGKYLISENESVFHLLSRAGGLTSYADHNSIYVIRNTSNMKRIRFKFEDLSKGKRKLVFFPIKDGDILYAE